MGGGSGFEVCGSSAIVYYPKKKEKDGTDIIGNIRYIVKLIKVDYLKRT